jgi:hypothetical protein
MKKLNEKQLKNYHGGYRPLGECNIYWGLYMTATDSISRESYAAAYVSAGCAS